MKVWLSSSFLPTLDGSQEDEAHLIQWEPLTPTSPRQLYDPFCSPEKQFLHDICLKYTCSSQNTDPMTCPLPLEAQKHFPSCWNHLFPDRNTQQKILTFHCRPKVRGPGRLLKSSESTKPKCKYRWCKCMNTGDTRLNTPPFHCKSYSAWSRKALHIGPIINWLVDDW